MLTPDMYENNLQFDYFSDNFQRFEEDFYEYSDLNVPLTFITDDLLKTMAKAQTNYFKLIAKKALDHQDHYFVFRVRTPEENPQIRIYEYLGHQSQQLTLH
ncbi:hypothetical protein HZY88_00885 [Aerococcaceae bacterium DSM 111176]|nr:hypothetical protein [Aerococcaceae bacterium DSM 111176]